MLSFHICHLLWESLESLLLRRLAITMGGAVMSMVGLPFPSPFFFFLLSWYVLGGPMIESMVIKDTLEAIKSILDEEDLMRI